MNTHAHDTDAGPLAPVHTNGNTAPSDAHGWQRVSARPVPVLRLTLEHYRHATGADHYHLACDDEHRAFSVRFRTIPTDSTGLPHILEHVVLCGSERYPVRDPFFNMLRRSLNTFMNAMTGSDGTYYPFATQVEKDFDNLLGIYLDAAFRPILDPLDFNQEGFRLEPAGLGGDEAGEAGGPAAGGPEGATANGRGAAAAGSDPGPDGWAFKGIVYNEMKGARANADSQVYQALTRALVPATPYRFDSGGDPAVIPELRHADLVAFHRRHYAAANACFATYGKLDVAALHARFTPYLVARPGHPVTMPPPQPPLASPATVDVPVPLEPEQDPRDVTVARLAWLWHAPMDLPEMLLGDLLDHLLLGHAGAPLRRALESSGLGRALGWSGYGDIGRNGLFMAALKGMDPADYPEFEPLVVGCLAGVARDGFDPAEVRAALHQLELSRRTITGDRFPFGLELGMRVHEAWGLGLDPLGFLDMEAELARLAERAATPGFLEAVVRARLLDNPHRVLILARPDAGFNAREAAAERERLAARVAALDADTRARLAADAAALAERQAHADDPSVLPDLDLADIPAVQRWASGTSPQAGLTVYETGTNGILHQVAALPLGGLSDDEVRLLPLLTATVGALGVGALDYARYAARLNAICGGISAWSDLRAPRDDHHGVEGHLFFEVSGLARMGGAYAGLISEALAGQRFDEHARLREIVERSLAGLQQRVEWAGHGLASQAAARGFGGQAGLWHGLDGLGRLAWLKQLDQRIRAGEPAVAELAADLAALWAKLRGRPVTLALIGDTAADAAHQAEVLRAWDGWALAEGFAAGARRIPAPAPFDAAPVAYTTATQVNHCATAFPTVGYNHPDAAALAVGARYLTWNYLHPRIREQGGAYGGGASCDTQAGTFSLTSYRDPRLTATLDDMAAGVQWLARIDDDERLLREAILDHIGTLDRPRSPAGEGRRRFVGDLVGYGPDVVNDYRRRVLAVTPAAIRAAAERWLQPERAARAVVSSEALVAAAGLGWETVAL